MAVMAMDFVNLIPALKRMPHLPLWIDYDREADVLYVNFRMPAIADGGDEVEPDVIERTAGDEVIGYTILNASRKLPA
jgi:uncharacterized protein YuzE